MRKKIVAMVISMMMLGLAGCGSTNSSGAASSAASPAKAAANASSETAKAAASEETAAASSIEDKPEVEVSKGDYGFPNGSTITWIVPGKAGGGSDLTIRYLSEAMTRDLGLTNTVTNYDSNTVGHQQIANAKPDGSTITLATAALNIQWITGNADVNPKKDLTLIAAMDDNGFSALCAPANAPYDTFEEMIAYAKENPGKLNAGMPSSGNNTLQFGKIQKTRNVQFNPVEASSESDRLTSLSGGFIDLGFVGIGNAKEYEKAGKLKVLATMAGDGLKIENYDSSLGDNYKTMQEQGYDDLYWNVKHYIYGPAGMDETQVKKMNAAVKILYDDQQCREDLISIGHVPEWHNLENSEKIRDAEYAEEVQIADYLGTKVND